MNILARQKNVFKLVLIQFQSRLKTIWLGGTDINDEGNFEWNDSNKSLVKNGYQRWTIGQPDNFDNEGGFQLLDLITTELKSHMICQKF